MAEILESSQSHVTPNCKSHTKLSATPHTIVFSQLLITLENNVTILLP